MLLNTFNMSDREGEVECQDLVTIFPYEVSSEISRIKLFNKWSYGDVD